MTPSNNPLLFFGRTDAAASPKLPVRLVAVVAALLLLALAPIPSRAQRVKLLTPTTGWVANSNHLYWTTDSGSNWSDITPVPPGPFRNVGLRGIFFLNTHEGWVAIYLPWKPVSLAPQPHRPQNTLYDIAHTVDGGQTWSFSSLTYPGLSFGEEDALVGPDDMYFLDSLHGWMVMAMDGSSSVAPGQLLVTDEGGKNWNRVNGPGTIGTLLFTSTQDGWLAGGPGGGHLYVTRNGGSSWEETNLKAELQGKMVGCGVLGPPHFNEPGHGFLAASCKGQAVIAFATADAGKTWNPIKELRESQSGGEFPVAIADSTLVVPIGAGPKGFKTAAVPLHGEVESPVVVSRSSALGLAFADRSHGFALSIQGRLLFTADGGVTWKDVSPWPKPKFSPLPPGITVKHPKIQIEVTHPPHFQ